jgi:hypothetical protein
MQMRLRHVVAGSGCMLMLLGCQARQMVSHYASFDAVVTDLYDKHVLYNLARRDVGRTMVQMEYKGFAANLSSSTSMSGKIQFFANPDDTASGGGATISLNAFRQAFEPNLSNSTSSGLAINSAPALRQEAIRALYDEQVNRPEDERIYRRTSILNVAVHACCWIRTAWGDLYYVPRDKQREFSDFVHKVSFYEPPSPPAAGPAPATAPTAADRPR